MDMVRPTNLFGSSDRMVEMGPVKTEKRLQLEKHSKMKKGKRLCNQIRLRSGTNNSVLIFRTDDVRSSLPKCKSVI